MPIQRGDSLAKPLPGTCDTAYSFPWAQIRNSWADKSSLASSRPRSSLLCIFLRQNLGLTTSQAIFPSLNRPVSWAKKCYLLAEWKIVRAPPVRQDPLRRVPVSAAQRQILRPRLHARLQPVLPFSHPPAYREPRDELPCLRVAPLRPSDPEVPYPDGPPSVSTCRD